MMAAEPALLAIGDMITGAGWQQPFSYWQFKLDKAEFLTGIGC